MRLLRTALTFTSLLLASAIAAPSAGAFHEAVNTGDTGLYTITDTAASPGVRCTYENNPGSAHDEIDKIRVASWYTHGPFAHKTWVGYRFVIKKNSPPYADGKFRTEFRSSIIKKRANDSEIATFPARTWLAPENSKARYRVHVLIYYYEAGSQSVVGGRVRGLMEVYLHKMAPEASFNIGTEGGPAGFCAHDFTP